MAIGDSSATRLYKKGLFTGAHSYRHLFWMSMNLDLIIALALALGRSTLEQVTRTSAGRNCGYFTSKAETIPAL